MGNKLTLGLTAPITAIGALGLAYNAQIERYTTAFTTFLGSAEKANEAIERIKQDAARTPFDTASLVQANQLLVSTGIDAEQSRQDILALGEAIIATGGGNEELTRMAVNLQQIRNAGKATSLDIKQFAYAGIDVYGILADYTGKATAEVKDMEISYEDLVGALKKASSKGGKYFNAMSNASQTLTGQTTQLKAEVQDMLGELTKGLMPTAKKLVQQARDLTKRFNSLSDAQKENIVRIGLMVAAAGPLIKIFGTLTSTAGGVVKGVGKVSQAIGVMRTGAASTSTSVNMLAKVLSTLTTPTGALVAVFATLTAAFGAYVLVVTAKTRELIGETNKQQKAWEDLGNSRNEMLSNSMTEISYLEKLKSELANITDENGKVKDGYEKRAQVILNELNKALETEYKLNGNIIQNYKEIDSAIDKIIRKKKLEATLTAYQEEYQQAIKEQANATEKLIELQEKQRELIEKGANDPYKGIVQYKEYEKVTKEIGEQAKMITEYGKTITDYEELQKASISGSAEEIEKAIKQITTSYDKQKIDVNTSITEQIKAQKTSIEELKKNYEEAKKNNNTYLADILKQQISGYNEQLIELERSLIEQTKKVEELTPEQINAWKNLAQDDFNVFLEGLSQLPEGIRTKIEEATGIVTNDTSLKNATLKLGDGASSTFLGTFKLQEGANQEVNATSQQLNGNNQIKMATEKIAQEATKEFEKNTDGKKWGNDLVSNLATGLTGQQQKSMIAGAASGLAGIIKKYIGHSVPAAGPLKDEMSYMPDMIDNLVKTLDKASPKLNNKTIELAKMMSNNLNIEASQGKLNQEIVSQSKNIFTTPQIVFNVQELDKEKLDQCFNYVNMKFGSAY